MPSPPTTLLLRPATHADIAAVQRVGRDADARYRHAGHPELDDGTEIPEPVAAGAIAESRLWVACVDDLVVGFAYVGRIDGEPCLGQLSVAIAHGRRGIGAALLRGAMQRAREAGATSMVLNAQADVPWGGPFYAGHGFVVVPENEWSPALAKVTAQQREAGLDWSTRVHMRAVLESQSLER
ncbi:MAG: GNAT family N-acetyltransferase [Polyangiaceae bacterium]|nr:GNAT family N-acetyltransferase [Polyangiaceae bacterium]